MTGFAMSVLAFIGLMVLWVGVGVLGAAYLLVMGWAFGCSISVPGGSLRYFTYTKDPS